MSHPWMKFYPRDWRGDQSLRAVSLAARGLWIEMLMIMHEADPYGHLVLGAQPVSNDVLSRMAGTQPVEIERLLAELETAGVYSRTGRGVIYSRRMTRDRLKANKCRKAAKTRWAEPTDATHEKLRPNRSTNGSGERDPPDPHMPRSQNRGYSSDTSEGADPSSSLRSEEAGKDIDPRTVLFRQGLSELAAISGRPGTKLRGMLGKWLKTADDDPLHILSLISQARQDRPAEPIAWIEAHLKRATGPPNGFWRPKDPSEGF